jgi:hypothetical protein
VKTWESEHRLVECAGCGFVPEGISPGDASVAIRSFLRRFRELLVPDREPDQAVVTYRPSPQAWSALEHVGHLADALHVAANRLLRVRAGEHPPLGGELGVASPAVEDPANLDVVLARLRDSCARLAGEIDKTAPEDWQRVGLRNRQEVSTLELVREAVHEGAHHLREVEAVLSQARRALGRPEPPPDD